MNMKTLKELCSAVSIEAGHLVVRSVVADSRQITDGSLFVAIKGGGQDGHDFILTAESQGAVAVVGEREKPVGLKLPYLRVADSRLALAQLAAEFYGNPSHSLLMVGVTGTSGKTTTTYLIESILQAAGHQVGVIGTVNFRYGKKILDSTHTTPGPVELQRLFVEMKKGGCTAIVMEVSSHSLKQHRTAGIAFDGMVFTNLTPEHLDFHPDMEDYFRAKALLFTESVEYAVKVGKRPYGAINGDDEYGARLFSDLTSNPYPSFGLGRFSLLNQLMIRLGGIEGRVGEVAIRSALAGQFNAYNILAAVEVCKGMGISPADLSAGVAGLSQVPGRLERIPNSRGVHVFVDYAHKSDALEKVLSTLREVKGENRLLVVFGCGGDRDRKKRPVMGRLAVEFADFAFVTSDNPRTESPHAIISEILKGIPSGSVNFTTEPDRKKAIFAAIQDAKKGDIVVIAGKGHEDYQIIADPSAPNHVRKIHFDDREVAAEALSYSWV